MKTKAGDFGPRTTASKPLVITTKNQNHRRDAGPLRDIPLASGKNASLRATSSNLRPHKNGSRIRRKTLLPRLGYKRAPQACRETVHGSRKLLISPLVLCGWSSCLSWDIHDSDSLQPGKCYRVDAKVGKDELKPVLQRGAHCGMSGVASIPDGYAVEVNGLEGSWPEGQDACRAPAARDKQKVTSPHCSSKTGCMENEGFGNNGSPGDWSRYCAFKLVPL